jgi:transcription elongation factor GreA
MKSSKEKEAALRFWQSSPVYLTPAGLKLLKEKLARLERILPGLISETQRTRGYGDTSDNAEYKDAKMASRRVQRQILSIQDQLKKVEIIKAGPSSTGRVQIGSTVVLRANDGKQKIFQVLGSPETNPAAGRISFESPLGAALMDKAPLDRVMAQTPQGPREYLIVEIY